MNRNPPLFARARLYLALRIDSIARRLLLLGVKAGALERRHDAAQKRGDADRRGKAP
jgi:hypothetical protein